jgi:hypothetical protein
MAKPAITQVRRFNRIVTERVGALNEHFHFNTEPYAHHWFAKSLAEPQ